ncbi:hypothetical protein [Bacillus atrophaeus]|uniref:hypothetical protein n=1 Tax=Bacillus atrophaeus TaxID=1452 RepID=UPI002DBEA561|nr:hypothetical protein [Bacillus atrophaeus]MEC0695644.1 hypothetical protein [Bacillus atrophaeus]
MKNDKTKAEELPNVISEVFSQPKEFADALLGVRNNGTIVYFCLKKQDEISKRDHRYSKSGSGLVGVVACRFFLF